jgi:hypothetical protein
MSCYVDTVRAYPEAGLRYTEFCHLLADDPAELHALAGELGMPRQLFQDHPWRWHYDLPAHLRPRAIELGALEVTLPFVGALLKQRRASVQAGVRAGVTEPAVPDPVGSMAITVCRLAIDPHHGRLNHRNRVGIAVRGALFAELALTQRLRGERLPRAIGDSERTGELADSLHRAVAQRPATNFKRWFSHTGADVEAALRTLRKQELVRSDEAGQLRDADPGLAAEQALRINELLALSSAKQAVPIEDAVVALLATGAGIAGGRPRPRLALARLDQLLPPVTEDVHDGRASARAAVRQSLIAVRRAAGGRFLSG